MSPSIAITLASASPRRRALLERAGLEVRIAPPEIDETPHPGEAPAALVERLAREKAAAVDASPDAIVVAGDTIVLHGDEILGKPRDAEDAARMLTLLSGSSHEVLSGWCVRRGETLRSGVVVTRIRFRTLDLAEIERSVASGEPLDKAGAYAIQGGGAAFVESIDGDRDSVVGLPLGAVLPEIRRLAV
jgi:septum formation protein